MEPLAAECNGEHLSNVNIAKILTLNKVLTSQLKIALLIKGKEWTSNVFLRSPTLKSFRNAAILLLKNWTYILKILRKG